MEEQLNNVVESFIANFETTNYSKYTQIPIKYEFNLSPYLKPGIFKDLYDKLYIEGWFIPISLINMNAVGAYGCPYIVFLKIYNTKKAKQHKNDIFEIFYSDINLPRQEPTLLEDNELNRLFAQIREIDGTLLCDVIRSITNKYLMFVDDIPFDIKEIKRFKNYN